MLLGAETHLNTCFKHFIYFIDQFQLVDSRELAPLAELIQQFKERKNEQMMDGPSSQNLSSASNTAYNQPMLGGHIGPSATAMAGPQYGQAAGHPS